MDLCVSGVRCRKASRNQMGFRAARRSALACGLTIRLPWQLLCPCTVRAALLRKPNSGATQRSVAIMAMPSCSTNPHTIRNASSTRRAPSAAAAWPGPVRPQWPAAAPGSCHGGIGRSCAEERYRRQGWAMHTAARHAHLSAVPKSLARFASVHWSSCCSMAGSNWRDEGSGDRGRSSAHTNWRWPHGGGQVTWTGHVDRSRGQVTWTRHVDTLRWQNTWVEHVAAATS